jgi:uncharacterized protein (TIGR03435 family)
MRGIIRMAYGGLDPATVLLFEVYDGPSWLDSERYDLAAKAEGGPSSGVLTGPMLRTLLEERLKLRAYMESRDAQVFELTVLGSSPNLHSSKEGSCTPTDPYVLPAIPQDASQRYCGWGRSRAGPNGTTIADWYGISIAEFAIHLFPQAGRPVIDRTDLRGRFDIHLEYSPEFPLAAGVVQLNGEPTQLPAAAQDSSGPSVFGALQQQLGMKLVPAKGKKQVLVIDSVERRSEN